MLTSGLDGDGGAQVTARAQLERGEVVSVDLRVLAPGPAGK